MFSLVFINDGRDILTIITDEGSNTVFDIMYLWTENIQLRINEKQELFGLSRLVLDIVKLSAVIIKR